MQLKKDLRDTWLAQEGVITQRQWVINMSWIAVNSSQGGTARSDEPEED